VVSEVGRNFVVNASLEHGLTDCTLPMQCVFVCVCLCLLPSGLLRYQVDFATINGEIKEDDLDDFI
jgi:hypothetical protein